ncbi:MAG TPA: ribosome small subunit-dependent GTPase A [Spirochaetota bacterium]|nr:ribosome small subunit-dependent GTPase A [Spirochaetota bacterium]HPR49434.1 ribosome small subunit-dependent GTPase A [Spirochaetota bacterium]
MVKTFGRYYTVRCGASQVNCVLRGKIRLDDSLDRYSEPVAVGDTVSFDEQDDGTGVINEIRPRKNAFTRKDRGRSKEDIIAANLDQLVIIQSFVKPKLNLRFVDRVAVRGEKESIPTVLCVNKADLAGDDDIKRLHEYYSGSPLAISVVSAVKRLNLVQLKKILKGKTSLFIGTSGVGKSTILNSLFKGLELRISEVSESTGKGRHTTTNAEMIIPEKGTAIIDTPGVREFGLMDIEPPVLARYFHEFGDLDNQCRFQPCTHDHEPGCRVKELVESGVISHERYISYLNILHSIKEYYDTRYQ